MILNATNQALEILLGAAVTTNQLAVTVDYVEFSATEAMPKAQAANTNGTTAVTILSAPASAKQRKVNGITVYNADTTPDAVTIRINANGTFYPVLSGVVIPAGFTLQFVDGSGWRMLDASGLVAREQVVAYSNVQVFTGATGTYTIPAGVSTLYVECVGGGGAGGSAQGALVSDVYCGGGGGGGKRATAFFAASDIGTPGTGTVSITVAQQKTGATGVSGFGVAANNGLAGDNSSFGTFLIGYGGGGGGGGGTASSSSSGRGGGGGGGTSAGGSGTAAAAGTGGSAFLAASAANMATDVGPQGSAPGIAAYHSYAGGGGGSGGGNGGMNGGNSVLSAGGGGGGGQYASSTSYAGGAGGYCAGDATASSTGAASASINTGTSSGNGAAGDSTKCGGGGAGGAANNAGKGSNGGNGGFPGGGGGGGGASYGNTGGNGGNGAAGRVVIYAW